MNVRRCHLPKRHASFLVWYLAWIPLDPVIACISVCNHTERIMIDRGMYLMSLRVEQAVAEDFVGFDLVRKLSVVPLCHIPSQLGYRARELMPQDRYSQHYKPDVLLLKRKSAPHATLVHPPPPKSLSGVHPDMAPLPLKRKSSSPRGTLNQATLRYYCGYRPSRKAESLVSLSIGTACDVVLIVMGWFDWLLPVDVVPRSKLCQ